MRKRKYRELDKYIERVDTEKTHGWNVSISFDKTGFHSKLFADSTYGGKWQAKSEAIHYTDGLYSSLFGTEIPAKVSHLSVVQ